MLRKLLVLPLLLLPLAAPAAVDPTVVRGEFLEALAATPRGLPAEDDSETLRAYPLYPYLEASRLNFRLGQPGDPPDDAIAAFLTRDGDAPWTRDLRHDWLESLAERQQWPKFLAFYLPARADATLRCGAVNAAIATGPGPSVRDGALAIWRSPSDLPPACASIEAWLQAQGALTADEFAGRARLALEAGKLPVARAMIQKLPEDRRAPYALWAQVLDDPQRYLENAVRAGLEPKAVLAGFTKIARADQDAADAMLNRLQANCGTPCALQSPASVGELRREVALNMAWSRRPDAVGMFLRVPETAIDDRASEWRVRAALWNRNWKQAATWLAAMSPTLAQQQRWRYWRARCSLAQGPANNIALADLEGLASENGYYSFLASHLLDRAYAPRPGAARPADPATRAALESDAGLARAHEAWLVDQPAWARTEWAEATVGFDATRQYEAARLAFSWGWYLMAVAAASKAEVYDDFDLLYPRPYDREIAPAAERAALPPEWLYGVLRQESLYDPRAQSSADALGLLQLLPDTARAVARRNNQAMPVRTDLFDPKVNIRLGAIYLREQVDLFFGRLVLALAAYNAGPNAVRRWLPEQAVDADVWIENVPFNETRNYIQRIVFHTAVFGWKATGKPQREELLLAPIPSREEGQAAAQAVVLPGGVSAPPSPAGTGVPPAGR